MSSCQAPPPLCNTVLCSPRPITPCHCLTINTCRGPARLNFPSPPRPTNPSASPSSNSLPLCVLKLPPPLHSFWQNPYCRGAPQNKLFLSNPPFCYSGGQYHFMSPALIFNGYYVVEMTPKKLLASSVFYPNVSYDIKG